MNLAGLIQGGSGLMDIVKQLQAAQTAANKANEDRYQSILGTFSSMGQAGEARIGQAEQQAQAKNTQDLTNRGLGNTTVTSSTNRGIASDAEYARQTLAENVATSKAKVMEAKTDQGPDMSMYANLLSKASAAQTAAKPRTVSGGTGNWAQGFSQWQQSQDVGGGGSSGYMSQPAQGKTTYGYGTPNFSSDDDY
jgi:hypothetical protein